MRGTCREDKQALGTMRAGTGLHVTQEDFMKAVRKVAEAKKLETKLDYSKV